MKNKIIFTVTLFLTLISCTNDDDATVSDEKEIIAFSFLVEDNAALSEDIKGTIDKEKKTITLAFSEVIDVTSLKSTIEISEKATVSPNSQVEKDFSNPVIYTVTAEDESTSNYTITVTVPNSDEKEITSFVFLAEENGVLSADVTGTIDETNKTIIAELPYNTALTALVPTLTISFGAKVNPKDKVVGDFTNDKVYTVTAVDGTTEEYTISVTNAAITDRDVLIAWYNANPDNTLSWDFSESIETWEGVTVENGRVTAIALGGEKMAIITPLIQHLTEMTTLQLYSNGIQSIPEEIGNLNKLRALRMIDNELTALPVGIGNLSAMEYLVFHNNDLTQIPPTIGNLTELIELDLTFNDLNAIPEEIGTLTKLKSLSVYGSRNLASIPIEIGNLTELLNLSLGYCNLSSVPDEIGDLTKLVDLRIDENQLTAIPKEIGNLSSLLSLKLQKNLLTELPSELGMLSSLVELNIEENQITVIPQEICDLDDASLILIKDPGASCP